MRKIIIFLILLLIVGIAAYFKFFHKEEIIHYHAGFQVYIDDKLQDFSSYKYMELKPCGQEEGKEDDQMEKAHLHDGIGDVVHVHRNNAVWEDLFKNIRFSLDEKKGISSYVNGKEIDDILTYPIKPYDSVVIFVGKAQNVEQKLKNRVTRKRIEDVEKMSESCGKT